MKLQRPLVAVALAIGLVAVPALPPPRAQEAAAAAAPATAQPLAEAEIDALLAPLALYPDTLIAQVLPASTYPLEIVQLQRWLTQNPGLSGDALDAALAAARWDDSVKALARFPTVVAMMDGEIEWTQRLGDAFLADPAGVMAAVQRLRGHALANGSLRDSDRQRIVQDQGVVYIEPVQPEVVYVPVYDPLTVYGSWWWPGYPPYAWSAAYFGPWDYMVGGLYFGVGVAVGGHGHGHWHADWHGGHVSSPHPGGNTVWHHDPGHRGGVPYSGGRWHGSPGTHPGAPDGVHARQPFRGFDVHPSAPQGARPSHPPAAAPAQSTHPFARAPLGRSPLSPVPHGNIDAQSQRGRGSLHPFARPSASPSAPHSVPHAAAPSAPPSAPSASPRGHR